MTHTLDPERDIPHALPRWSFADVFPSLDSAEFRDAMERASAEITRLVAVFDEHDVRSAEPRPVTTEDGVAADEVIAAYNRVAADVDITATALFAATATDSRDEQAQALLGQVEMAGSALSPLLARLADWVHALGVDALAAVSREVAEHVGPLRRLDARSAHQMSEAEEHLYAELATTGSNAWGRLQQDVTSQLSAEVVMPDGASRRLPMPAVRGLASDSDPAVRRAAYDAELAAWPAVATAVAAAMNAVKGEANTVLRRRHWGRPIDSSLHSNAVSPATFDAMQDAVTAGLPDFRRWMRIKSRLHGHDGGLPWWDLVGPLPEIAPSISWDEGLDWVRGAFGTYSEELGGLIDRALQERWIDAEARDGKAGGAFCASFVDDRSLVLLNWSGSVESAQTTAHELGHAYHNTTLAGRTALQKDLPMALAETASIFCETLAVEAGLARLSGAERLALLDVDLAGANQVMVDIRSRYLFETEVFTRRQRRTLGVSELNEAMLEAQEQAYGDGLDLDTRNPWLWLLKPHYYVAHFYNWPYTFGHLFGLGLYARYREDPERFRRGYADLLSRAGMETAEELAAGFDLDVTDVGFWTASIDVLRARIDEYEHLADEVLPTLGS